ncbi:MAG: ATP-dependent DNA helicase RecG [Rhodospirillales bacterium]|nr:ATP-dependent DNA helicase RecG [Rhodospirillales bacterium]
MRPEILFPLFTPVTGLDGVGPRLARLVEKVAGPRIVDLLWHLPTGIIERTMVPDLGSAIPDGIVTVSVTVGEHRKPHNRRQPYRIACHDDTSLLTLVFFHAREDYLTRLLPVGTVQIVSGKLERYGDDLQMVHPDHVVTPDKVRDLPQIEPVYPLTEGLTLKVLRKAVAGTLSRLIKLPEWIDRAWLEKQGWSPWDEAVRQAHAPRDRLDLERNALPRARLAFDELLANQLALALVRASQKKARGRPVKGNGALLERVERALPFSMTGSQRMAVAEILGDMATDERMLRLLQGDVGSGKTLVALMAMLNAVETGCQAALLAPTELLARQHHATLSRMVKAAGVEVVLLTGRDKGKARAEKLERLAAGRAQITVGTHALIQGDVAFHDLALVVIDEQHRFGVHQRLALTGKGQGVHVLVMTATPIPRTLQMTAYGDLDVSRLTEKPAGRKPVETRAMPLDRLGEVIQGVARAIGRGDRVYWLCPLVEESEVGDLATAEERHKALSITFGDRVGLIHGRMKGREKDAVMERFVAGDLDILVATTVIEVGVDVPDATIMVIEHAERFGLAQLHQLRGRVGRGDRPSSCLLLYAQPLGEMARSRINILRQSEDGFEIAEEDLRLRGAGELLGTRQSGFPQFRISDVIAQADLLAAARDDARLILARDPELSDERGKALRVLLYLFERDAAVRLLRSG